MFIWAVVLLVINIAFMGGILYILLCGRGTAAASPAGSAGTAGIEGLKKELSEIRRAASALGSEIDRAGTDFADRKAALEKIADTVGAGRGPGAFHEGRTEDVYSKALKMYSSGVPVNEIAKILGLLNGEAELLCSLKRL